MEKEDSKDNKTLKDFFKKIKKNPEIAEKLCNLQKIILPLYSYRKGTKKIHEKSGLNQGRANGRPRNFNEVYIPFNINERNMFLNFFPNHETCFKAILPDQNIMIMKLCQQNSKALMSNPNKDLGKWILRDVLEISDEKIVTYDDLCKADIDSISFEKIDNNSYKINFEKVGSYELFLNDLISKY